MSDELGQPRLSEQVKARVKNTTYAVIGLSFAWWVLYAGGVETLVLYPMEDIAGNLLSGAPPATEMSEAKQLGYAFLAIALLAVGFSLGIMVILGAFLFGICGLFLGSREVFRLVDDLRNAIQPSGRESMSKEES